MAKKKKQKSIRSEPQNKVFVYQGATFSDFYCRQDTQHWRRTRKFGRHVRKLRIWFPV